MLQEVGGLRTPASNSHYAPVKKCKTFVYVHDASDTYCKDALGRKPYIMRLVIGLNLSANNSDLRLFTPRSHPHYMHHST